MKNDIAIDGCVLGYSGRGWSTCLNVEVQRDVLSLPAIQIHFISSAFVLKLNAEHSQPFEFSE
jgi:hypothetical protein